MTMILDDLPLGAPAGHPGSGVEPAPLGDIDPGEHPLAATDTGDHPSDDALMTAPLERLEATMVSMASDLAAAEYRWLRVIGVYTARRGHETWGCATMAQWLSRYCALSPQSARDRVRVAAAMSQLPAVCREFSAARLSYSQVRAICRVAEPETEDLFVGLARHATAEQLERIVSGYRRARHDNPDQPPGTDDPAGPSSGDTPDRTDRSHGRDDRYQFVWWWADDGSLIVSGRLSPDDGAVLLAAITHIDDRADVTTASAADPAESPHCAEAIGSADMPTRAERAADALVEIAHRSLHAQPDPAGSGPDDRYHVTLTADLDILQTDATPRDATPHDATPHDATPHDATPNDAPRHDAPSSDRTPEATTPALAPDDLADATDPFADARPLAWRLAELHPGRGVAHEDARRIACDCTLHRVLLIGNHPVDHATHGRVVPTRLRRALRRRDIGCCFPGCGRHGRLHAHHIVHWADHGPTILTNLVLLCPYHHRLVHAGGYTVATGHQDSPHLLGLAFRRPDATLVPFLAPPLPEPGVLPPSIGTVTPHAFDPLDLHATVGDLCSQVEHRSPKPPGAVDVLDVSAESSPVDNAVRVYGVELP